jgi:hypothetical protein
MNISMKLAIFLVVAGLATGIFNVTNMAFADKPENPNLWGKEASQLAQDEGDEDEESGSEMGEHSRSNDLTSEPGRAGVGNIDEELEEQLAEEGIVVDVEDHPSGVVDFLCNGGSTCPEPNPAD